MKKVFNKILVFSIILLISFSFIGCVKSIPDPTITTSESIKNVILIIGDGMGFNHLNNAKTYFELDRLVFEDDYLCSVNTSSKSIGTTDSAAAATAMATGVNVYNKRIGMNGSKTLTNIMEIAISKNKKTGIITTDNLYGATPASFSSHTKKRSNYEDIIIDQANSNINLFVGQNSSKYTEYRSQFESNGYNMCYSLDELNSKKDSTKIVANIPNLKSIYNTNESNQTNFNLIAEYALDFLDNENGFVLMIECAHIDKFSHDNNLLSALFEVRTLIDIANTVYDFAFNRNDTAILITADHETGGLKAAKTKNDISNKLYTKSSHSSNNVPLFAYNCSFENVKEEVKNTFIFDICNNIVNH